MLYLLLFSFSNFVSELTGKTMRRLRSGKFSGLIKYPGEENECSARDFVRIVDQKISFKIIPNML